MSEANYEQVIGKNIKKERTAKGWSQTELGNRCQIANTVISAYENGKKVPGLNSVARIAKELSVTVDRLCYGDENEAFINSAPDTGQKIVNAIIYLWKEGVIEYEESLFQGMPFDEYIQVDNPRGFFLEIKKYELPIKRLINSLNQFYNNFDTYSEPGKYIELLKVSVANEINKMRISDVSDSR